MDQNRQPPYGYSPEQAKPAERTGLLSQHPLEPERQLQPLPPGFQAHPLPLSQLPQISLAQPPQAQPLQAPFQPSQQAPPRPYYQQYSYYAPLQNSSISEGQSSGKSSVHNVLYPYLSVLNQGPPVPPVPPMPPMAHVPPVAHVPQVPGVAQMPAPQPQLNRKSMPYPLPQQDILQLYPLLDQLQLPLDAPSSQHRGLNQKIRATEPTQKEFVEHLKLLSHKAAGVPLLQLAQKIKMLESSNPNIDADPIFKTLNNAKDIKQERHHQLFGMVWVQTMCEASPTAVVPRNRVYARYALLCASNNLNPLTPASFGKVLRILHPNLKTRRLGMRGKSKYHYCGIHLLDDLSLLNSGLSDSTPGGSESPQSLNPQTPKYTNSPSVSGEGTPIHSVAVQEALMTNPFKYVPNLFQLVEQSMGPEWIAQPFTLPSVHDYLPKTREVDYDVAETLHSLYRVHCMSIFETMKHLQIDKMLSLFNPFCAILTLPVFSLLIEDLMLEWVKESDLAMYRAMLKMLTRFQLEAVPRRILTPLKDMIKGYVSKLSASLHPEFPENFVQMKVTKARQFILMVRRFVRCVENGTTAAKVLSSQTERSLMLSDWLRVDTNEIIKREVPCASEYKEVFDEIFNDKIIKLFEEESPQAKDLNASGLAPYAAFLLELPAKFPDTNPWLFQLVCSNLLTTSLREMSLAGGQSFGSWWVFRCWADEYVNWFFELGGYLADEFQIEPDQVFEEGNPVSTIGTVNSSWAFEPLTIDSIGSSSYVDLLDRPNGDNKPYSENEWF